MKLFLLVCFAISTLAKVSYEGYEIWKVEVDNNDQFENIQSFTDIYATYLSAEGAKCADLLVSPKHIRSVAEGLMKYGLTYTVKFENIQKAIDEQETAIGRSPRAFSLSQYNTFEDIEAYLTQVAEGSDLATLTSIGQSHEGRDQWTLEISAGADKPIFWLDCGIHSREWVSQATCLYGIDLLVNGYGSDTAVTELLDKYDVYITPVANPDGYVYTWDSDRLWRKNRNAIEGNVCVGVDLNRNFDFHWNEAGTSSSSCSDLYAGPSADSEVETQNIEAALDRLSDRIAVFYSLHAYSQLWMYPFGFEESVPPEEASLAQCASAGVDALTAVYQTQYVYGPIAETIYPASGSSVDYVYNLGIVYAYTIELRDQGEEGFLLSEENMVPTTEETWAGILAAVMCVP